MKKDKKIIQLCAIISIINFVIYTFLYFDLDFLFLPQIPIILKSKIYLINISLGIFTSSFVTFLIAIRDYYNSKNDWLIKYFDIVHVYCSLFNNPEILEDEIINNKFNSVKKNDILNKIKGISTEIPIILDENGKEIPSNKRYKKQQIEKENQDKEQRIRKCKDFYICKYKIIKDKNLRKELNKCIDNIEFFCKKDTKKILKIYEYINKINNALTELVEHNFKYNNIYIEACEILKIQKILFIKKNEDNYIKYYNLYEKNMEHHMDTLRLLNYGKKIDEIYEKDIYDEKYCFLSSNQEEK